MHAGPLRSLARRDAREPQRRGVPMPPLSAPYRVHSKFGGRRPDKPPALPVPWAIRIEDAGAARVAVDCLKGRDVSRVEIVCGPDGAVYVRWED